MGRVTYRGMIPDDDPRYHEGWTVFIPQKAKIDKKQNSSDLEDIDKRSDDSKNKNLNGQG